MLRELLVTSLGLVSVPLASQASPPPPRVASLHADAAPRPDDAAGASVGELSARGTRHGGLELGLGSVLLATAGALVGVGVREFMRAREHVEFCRLQAQIVELDDTEGIDPCVFDPPPLGFAAAGLSWGFSIPLFVGAGMLIERGVRVRRDARAWRARSGERSSRLGPRWSLSPWWNVRARQHSGGASLSVRF